MSYRWRHEVFRRHVAQAKRIFYLLNREEAHNALFREALNKVQKSGSNKDFGVTEDSKLYFDLSTPGPSHEAPNPTPPSFENPRR